MGGRTNGPAENDQVGESAMMRTSTVSGSESGPESGPESSPESGMTLVELLVALVLLSFLALMLTGSLRFSIRAWERSEVQMGEVARIRLAQNLIRRYLSAARASKARTRTRRGKVAARPSVFTGGPDHVEFLAPLPAHLGHGGLYRIILDMAARPNGDSDLRIRWRPDQTGFESKLGDGDEEWRETILLSSIEDLTFSYFGAVDKKAEADWIGSWESALDTPTIVKLSVNFPDGDRRLWPELAVRLMLKSR